jgi:hypothetical protein
MTIQGFSKETDMSSILWVVRLSLRLALEIVAVFVLS